MSLSVLRSTASRRALVRSASSLTEELPYLPHLNATPLVSELSVGTSGKGLGVAAASPAHCTTATLGVTFNSGSRFESDKNAGISLLASKMAFRSTDHRSDLALYRAIEAIGGSVSSSAGRDYVNLAITVTPEHIDEAAAILAESVLAPRVAEWDVATQKTKAQVDIELLNSNADDLLIEGLHAAAFYDNRTLGRSVYSNNIAKLTGKDVRAFYDENVNAGNMVLVGRGVHQSTLNDIANAYFSDVAAGQRTAPAASRYIGGEHRVAGAVPASYVALGFSAGALSAQEKSVAHVLEHVLKSRLTDKTSAAVRAIYSDASLLGLRGVARPSESAALVDSFLKQFQTLASTPLTAAELEAAKKASGLCYSNFFDSKKGALTQLARSAFAQSAFTEATAFAGLNAVSAKDVQSFAEKLVASKPSLASVGDVTNVPRYDDLLQKL
ncbi:mitochondrial-processing peptidase subunit alpha [Thraustotheca clavata]|uniref:Mitochondrial-processing peptidase subunit alpha n=1 Tax=Thraustotheca clavata TaxID=74557 RepID=A0A1W0A8G6_9STRA|nr:mitochondrial-processing peptidase subunit alpha [Thraustotheca clavata]